MTQYITIGLIVAGVIALIGILMSGYVKSPPDKAFIISGLRKSKMIIGKASVRVPFFERLDKLDLATISVDVKTSTAVPTKNYINIKVDSVVNIKIPTLDILDDNGNVLFESKTLIARAQQNFLNQPKDYIAGIAREVLEGNIREIIGQMDLEEMVSNRQRFAQLVKENAAPDLAELGLSIISFNVQNFFDDTGTIENLGIDNIERIRKNAAIAKAQAQKEVAVAEAVAKQEMNEAQAKAALEIAKKNTDLEIKKSELKQQSDTQKAIAESAYRIQEEEQRKAIEIKTADANIARQEKEVELAEQQARIQAEQLKAEINKLADAEKYKEMQQADAVKYATEKSAEAEFIEKTKESEARLIIAENDAKSEKLKADAKRYVAEQEAIGIKAKGLAEAEAIEAQGLAKAKGLDAEAEAMKKMEQGAVIKTIMEAYPLIAKEIATPLANVDSITMYGEGNNAKLVGDITKSISQVSNGISDSLGISLTDIVKSVIGGTVTGNIVSNKIDEI